MVGDALLSDSGMRHHLLTPKHDANLVRVADCRLRRPAGDALHLALKSGNFGGPDFFDQAFQASAAP